jgi:hypothetical protein
MTDIEEMAFQICRYMVDKKFIGYKYVTAGVLREALNMSAEDFDIIDDYLREKDYYDATLGGDASELALKASGVDYVSRILANRFDLSSDAERLAKYLATKQSQNNFFDTENRIKTAFMWDDTRYSDACQILMDEKLVDVQRDAYFRFAVVMLNAEGRKAVRRNFQRLSSAVNVNGDYISVESSGENAAIAAGRGASVSQNINVQEIDRFFAEIVRQIEQHDLSPDKKQDLKDDVELSIDEAKRDKPNEKKLSAYFRNIALMAPDILDVAVAAASTPIIGPIPIAILIAKKVSEKVKADAQSK